MTTLPGESPLPGMPEPPAEPPAPPALVSLHPLVMAGTFAIYDDGSGGYVMVAELADGETVRRHIPGALVKMAKRFLPAGDAPAAGR